jgi:hypothetical protein
MYFPTSVARQLSTVPALPGLAAEPVITLSASSKKSLFCLLTRNGLTLWRVRVSSSHVWHRLHSANRSQPAVSVSLLAFRRSRTSQPNLSIDSRAWRECRYALVARRAKDRYSGTLVCVRCGGRRVMIPQRRYRQAGLILCLSLLSISLVKYRIVHRQIISTSPSFREQAKLSLCKPSASVSKVSSRLKGTSLGML